MLTKILIGLVVVIILGLFVWNTFAPKQSPVTQHQQSSNQQSSTTRGDKKPFYNKDGVYLTHSWPSEGNFSNEETEILLFNESDSTVEVKSFDLVYMVEGKTYPHKSGTWEKFPSKDNHERIEYINISPQYYKNEPLVLTQGQKGKLHWHINFGSQPLDGKQTVTVKLTLLKDGQTINIDETFNRDSGTVFSKDEH